MDEEMPEETGIGLCKDVKKRKVPDDDRDEGNGDPYWKRRLAAGQDEKQSSTDDEMIEEI